jgi:hypothetical protein
MVLDHKVCRNTLCVNPAHLEVVTTKENNERRSPLSYLGVHAAGWSWLVVQRIGGEHVEVARYWKLKNAIARALQLHGYTTG